MNIKGNDIGKKFGSNWIFKNLNFSIKSGDHVAITGKNGAGKSTLLQIISGYLTPSRGAMIYGESLPVEAISRAFISPYMDIIEEFTLREFLDFHSKFKAPIITCDEMADRALLPLNRRIIEFSTGMKQRTKLITTLYFDNELIFMDEPTSNLDSDGYEWWKSEINALKNKTIIVASNLSSEIEQCSTSINL